jgi:5-methylcytosine-specific restriction protein A
VPKSYCNQPRCPDLATYRGRCQRHARQRERETHRNKSIYNSKRWKMLRRKRLSLDPLCQWPGQEGHAIATDVDHITPIEEGGPAYSLANTQSLCRSHHSAKTNMEQRARGKRGKGD